MAVKRRTFTEFTVTQRSILDILCIFISFYFPNGAYIDWLPFTYATNKSKVLKLYYKY